MEEDKVVPDVTDFVPPYVLQVTYGSNNVVDVGMELTPTDVKDPPAVSWDADPDTYYTLVMVDPDAPSRDNPTFREVNHWLVGNIRGPNVQSGDVVTEYLGSGPPRGTGLHRYILLLYRQDEVLEFDEPRTAKLSRAYRLKFNVRNFAKKYGLGQPVAGNFFKAQWDEYVDVRNKNVTND